MSSSGGDARQGRLAEVLGATPPTTLLMTAACVAVFVVQAVQGWDLSGVAIATYPVMYQFQFYRILSSAFSHAGVMHIGMNMLSFFYMGASLERIFGTLPFLYILMLLVLLTGLFYVNACWVVAYGSGDISWLRYSAVGFSGVIFANAAQESFLSTAPTRSLFGLMTVPTRLYPWALLIVLQVIMPNISFLGHLAGLLMGLLHVRGKLQWAIPSPQAFQWLEEREALRSVRRLGGFVPTPDVDRVSGVVAGGQSLLAMAASVLRTVFAPCIACARPACASIAGMFGRRADYDPVPTADGDDAADDEEGGSGGPETPGSGPSPQGRTYGRGTWG